MQWRLLKFIPYLSVTLLCAPLPASADTITDSIFRPDSYEIGQLSNIDDSHSIGDFTIMYAGNTDDFSKPDETENRLAGDGLDES